MKKQSSLIFLIIAIIAVLGVLGVMVLKNKGSVPDTNISSSTQKGDINRDGKVDSMDAELVKNSSPCNHVDPCWKKVVGKTKDGDNPIYASDLDLNHDDNVNQLDISAMSTGQ